jgi:hypothetical protein
MNFINIDTFGRTFVATMTDLDKRTPGLMTNATENQLQVNKIEINILFANLNVKFNCKTISLKF